MTVSQNVNISTAFIWRRVHSLMGFWLVIYLIEHLLVNSQASLWIGDDGAGFVRMVNWLESLPYLQVIEWVLIGIPLLIHGIWGVKRALTARLDSFGNKSRVPHLTYGRNRAFTWQRLTSWILLFGIIGHVVQMRFIGMPAKVEIDNQTHYLTPVSFDAGLYTLAPRLNVVLYSSDQIASLIEKMKQTPIQNNESHSTTFSLEESRAADRAQRGEQERKWVDELASFRLKDCDVVAEAPMPGTAMLLMVRDTFKSPFMAVLYTIFVLAAAFHAFNGFWTFLIAWGAILSYRSQKAMIPVSVFGILVLSFLGLVAIWGSYWLNLRN